MNIALHPRLDWRNRSETRLTRNSINCLLRGDIPYIRISNFATAEECEALVSQAVEEGFSSYRGVEPVINRIGNTVFEYNAISKGEYFEKNQHLNKVQNRIFESSFNPLDRFLALLNKSFGRKACVAQNVTGNSYYAGLIRRIENGTLIHVDYAPGEQPGWEVASIKDQLVWNLYLRVSDPKSGKTHVFDRKWSKADDQHKEGIYGYNPRVVKGADEAVFEPAVGEVVIFNTRNYHFVEPTEGERVAFTSAIAQTQENELVLWS